MLVSDTIELVPVIGPFAGPLIRLYALCLCGLALASGQHMVLGKSWVALLLPVAAGLLLGLVGCCWSCGPTCTTSSSSREFPFGKSLSRESHQRVTVPRRASSVKGRCV